MDIQLLQQHLLKDFSFPSSAFVPSSEISCGKFCTLLPCPLPQSHRWQVPNRGLEQALGHLAGALREKGAVTGGPGAHRGPQERLAGGCYSTAGCSSSWVVRVSFQPCVSLWPCPGVWGGHGRDGSPRRNVRRGHGPWPTSPSGGCNTPDLNPLCTRYVLSRAFSHPWSH